MFVNLIKNSSVIKQKYSNNNIRLTVISTCIRRYTVSKLFWILLQIEVTGENPADHPQQHINNEKVYGPDVLFVPNQ